MKLDSPASRRLPAALALFAALLAAPAAAQLPAPPASAPGPLAAGGYAAVTLRAAPGDSIDGDLELNEAAVALLLSGTPWPRLSYFAEVEAASVSRETFTGREEERWVEVPSPSCPQVLSPQQRALPSFMRAQVCIAPAFTS